MNRADSQQDRQIWEDAQRPSLTCASRGLVTPDQCQSCYCDTAGRGSRFLSWCKDGQERRQTAAREAEQLSRIELKWAARIPDPEYTEAQPRGITFVSCVERVLRALDKEGRTATSREVMEAAFRIRGKRTADEHQAMSSVIQKADAIGLGHTIRKRPGTETARETARAAHFERVVSALVDVLMEADKAGEPLTRRMAHERAFKRVGKGLTPMDAINATNRALMLTGLGSVFSRVALGHLRAGKRAERMVVT